MLIVSDTTPIISLLKAGCIDLLQKMFGEIIIPKAVYEELISNPKYQAEIDIIRGMTYIRVENVSNLESVKILRNVTGLDAGESEAIVLMDEIKADLLLVDEHKARQIAKKMGITHTGTIGILLKAFDESLLNDKEVEKCVERLKNNQIHISETLYDVVYGHIKKDI